MSPFEYPELEEPDFNDMSTTPQTDTPRTDAAVIYTLSELQSGTRQVVDADFARTLERELEDNFARGIHTCHNQCTRIECVQRREIKRLESAIYGMQLISDGATKHIAQLEAECDELRTDKARLDSGRIMLTVIGDRVEFSGQNLRQAIDAAMKEGAK